MIVNLRHPLGRDRELVVAQLEVPRGETTVIFGPNGAGKTTLLRLLAGTLPGGPVLDAAYLPQHPVAFRGTTRHNLELGLNDVELQRAAVLVDELALSKLLTTSARSLSGGERQRMALARTVSSSRPVVLLDEPTAAIDLGDRGGVLASVQRALSGRTAIVVTHDRETAVALGDHIAVLVDGKIEQAGDVATVFSLPETPAAAGALGIANALSGTVMDSDDGLVALKVGPLVVWGLGSSDPVGRAVFGAEAVTLFAGHKPDSGSARNTWPGTVTEIRPVGNLVEVMVDCGPLIAAVVTPGAMSGLKIKTGNAVTVAVKATAVKVL